MTEAQRLADSLDDPSWLDEIALWPDNPCAEAAAELRRLDAVNEALRERLAALESDPAYDYCHRLAIALECMTLNADKNWDAACALLDEYNAARDKWAEAQGQPYVSPLGKD